MLSVILSHISRETDVETGTTQHDMCLARVLGERNAWVSLQGPWKISLMRNTETEQFWGDTRLGSRGWGRHQLPWWLKESPSSMKHIYFPGCSQGSWILHFKNIPRSRLRMLLKGLQTSGLLISPMITSPCSILCLHKNTFVKMYMDSWKLRKSFLGKCQPCK